MVDELKSELMPEQEHRFIEPESSLDQAIDHQVEVDQDVYVTYLKPSIGNLHEMIEDFQTFQVIEEMKDESESPKKGTDGNFGESLSHCDCEKVSFRDGLTLCATAKIWLTEIEKTTDRPIDYDMSLKIYENLQLNLISEEVVHQISLDVPRTAPEVPYFNDKEGDGQLGLKKILIALSNHPCSTGYT